MEHMHDYSLFSSGKRSGGSGAEAAAAARGEGVRLGSFEGTGREAWSGEMG